MGASAIGFSLSIYKRKLPFPYNDLQRSLVGSVGYEAER